MSFLEIFPQNVDLFPGARHLFTARAALTPLWTDVTGVVQPDQSVRLNSDIEPDNILEAKGAQRLMGGVGAVEFTINENCRPDSVNVTMTWRFFFEPSGSPWEYRLDFFNDVIEVTNEVGTLLASVQHNTASGDRVKVELASGFRLFLNGILRHEHTTFASAIKYPATYEVVIEPGRTAADPAIIPAPLLTGDWQLQPAVEFLDPAHGDLTTNGPAVATEYFDGEVPGQYTLAARIDPGFFIWFSDAEPPSSTVTSGGGTWNWGNTSPAPFHPASRLRSPVTAIVGEAFYAFNSTPFTFPVNQDDVLFVWVFIDSIDPTTEIMFHWSTTADGASSWPFRAYWGVNSIAEGVDGTSSRRFMGPLPPADQWVRLEVPARLVDLEGKVLKGMKFSVFDGRCSFDLIGKYPGKIQTAESLITIPPLRILGELTRTLQPDSITRLQTNYDVATPPTWSKLSGGGTVTADGVFTAPSAPGATVLRASASGNQVADMTVNIPAVITPGFTFAPPLEQIDFNTNIPSPTWSSVPSGINSGTGVIIFPNEIGRTAKIAASNGSFTATRDVLIIEKFPFSDFILPISWDRNLTALVSMSEDRSSRITREKAPPYDSYQIRLVSRTLTDSNAVDAFFDAKGLGTPFILEDELRGIRKVGWFDSGIRHEARDECDIDLSFQFLEARI
jgi:hypothetical protein